MRRWMIALTLVVLVLPSAAQARGMRMSSSNGQVVHSRRAGVIMHRAVPPFRGVHVYGGKGYAQTF
jgi:preprotein translocase subunit SecG